MGIYINREHLLKQIDYPARYRSENLLRTSAVIFSVLLIFLLLFRPFGVYVPEHKMNYLFICCLHALSPAIIIYVYFQSLNHFRAKYVSSKSWTLLREYVQVAIVLLIMGVASFLMRDVIYSNPDNWSWRYLWEEVRNCYVGGSFFYFILRLAGFYFQAKKGDPFVLQFIPLKCEPQSAVATSVLFIHTLVKQDDFSLDINNLLFARAEGNYIELTTMSGQGVQTELKRISLTNFESQLSGYAQFFRCHRTFLVNILYIEEVSGNSQGYLLAFSETEFKVPVSRAQLHNFNSRYEQLRSTLMA